VTNVDSHEVVGILGEIEGCTDEIEALRERTAQWVRKREEKVLELWGLVGRGTPADVTYGDIEKMLRSRMGKSNIRRIIERGPR